MLSLSGDGEVPFYAPSRVIKGKNIYNEAMKQKESKPTSVKAEIKDSSNLTGFFALLYRIDHKNKEKGNDNEDSKCRNHSG